jgi:hypothetical protein
LNRIQQILVAKGFRQELDCSRFHGTHGHGNIAVCRDKDYGNPILGLDQLALEIKPADSWQSDVEDKAACNIRVTAVYKFRCRPEQFYVQTYRFYQPFDGATDRGIVINHENDGSGLSHLASAAG